VRGAAVIHGANSGYPVRAVEVVLCSSRLMIDSGDWLTVAHRCRGSVRRMHATVRTLLHVRGAGGLYHRENDTRQ